MAIRRLLLVFGASFCSTTGLTTVGATPFPNDIVLLIPPQIIPWVPTRVYGHMGQFRYFENMRERMQMRRSRADD